MRHVNAVPVMHYKKAPIVEALLQVQFVENMTDADMGRVARKAESLYSHKEEMRDFQVKVRVHPGGATPEVGATKSWYRLKSKDGADVFVVNRNQFTVGRLAPYTTWSEFFGRFERDYELVNKVLGYRRVNRIGLRYINRIDVPHTTSGAGADIRNYLNVYPHAPNSMLESLLASQVRFEYTEPNTGAAVVLTSGTVEPVLIDHVSFLLDIDVVVQRDIPIKRDDLIENISTLRAIKNDVFETLITDASRRLFDA